MRNLRIWLFPILMILCTIFVAGASYDDQDLYYKFDGDATDSGSVGNSVDLVGSNNGFVAGIVDQAIDFETGSAHRMEGNVSSIFGLSEDIRTISCWVNFESFGATGVFVATTERDNPTQNYLMCWSHVTAPDVRCNLKTSGTTRFALATGVPLDTGKWYQMVLTFGASGAKLYWNGSQTPVDSDADTTILTSDFDFVSMGGAEGWAVKHDGLLDNCIYDSDVWSPQEVEDSWNNGNGISYTLSDTTPPVNSSWNVSSDNVVFGENSATWIDGGTVNITSDLLSLTVSTDENSNMSCRLDVEGNYSENIAFDSRTKSATTETTSHAMTLFQNISEGNHCVYCSFIDEYGNGEVGGKSSSGCLPLNFERDDTTIEHFNVHVNEAIIDGVDFQRISEVQINLTSSRNVVGIGSLMVSKFTHPFGSVVSMRVLVNDSVVFSDEVRTLSSGDDVGSVSIRPISFVAGRGTTNLSIEFSEDGLGSVNVSNLDFHFLTNHSAQNSDVGLGVNNIDYSFTGNDMEGFNIYKNILSGTYFDLSSTISASGSSNLRCNVVDGLNSPYYSRHILDAVNIGSAGINFVSDDEIEGVHEWSLNCSEDSGETVLQNISYMFFDLRDGDERDINAFQVSNDSSDVENTISVIGDKEILSYTYVVVNSSSVHLSESFSVQSVNADQTPYFYLSSNNSLCGENGHLRYFEDVSEVGNIKIYSDCEGVSVGDSISFIMGVRTFGGDEVLVLDESLSGFESISLDTSSFNLPPSVTLLSPSDGDNLYNFNEVEWFNLDLEGNPLSVDVVVENSTGTVYNSSFGDDVGSVNLNFSVFGLGFYNVSVFVQENDTADGFWDEDVSRVKVIDPPFFFVNLISPVNNSLLNDFVVDFVFSVNNLSVCNLYLNGSLNESMVAVEGSNSFMDVGLENKSYLWNVECNGTFSQDDFLLRIDYDKDFVAVFGVGGCPATLVNSSIIWLMFSLCLFFITMGFVMRVGFLGFMGSLLMLICCWYIAGCFGSAVLLLGGIAVALMVWFITRSFFVAS